MCTTMRKLRRGTPAGITLKLYKRSLTQRIKALKRTLLTHNRNLDVTEYMRRVSHLNRLRSAVKFS